MSERCSGFRDRWETSPDLARLIAVIETFDEIERAGSHMRLTIELPSAFFRYAMTMCMPHREWGAFSATLEYSDQRNEIEFGLAEASCIANDMRIGCYRSDSEQGYDWYRLEASTPPRLSLADAQRFVIFLLNHFRCFDLTMTTRLSK